MCPAIAELRGRAKAAKAEAIAHSQSAYTGHDPICARGVMAAPREEPSMDACFPSPCNERWEYSDAVRGSEEVGFLTGDVATDGSMVGSKPKQARRGGYAAVMVDGEGKILQVLYGSYGGPAVTTFKTELYAALIACANAVPPLRIWTDCRSVVETFNRGKRYCCNARRGSADLWRLLWEALWEWGVDTPDACFKMKWIKGHATEQSIRDGVATNWTKMINEHVDNYATRGSVVAIHKWPNEHICASYKRAVGWYKWLADLIEEWPGDADTTPVDQQLMIQKPDLGTDGATARNEHLIWRNGKGGGACAACGAVAKTEKALKALKSKPCSGKREENGNRQRPKEHCTADVVRKRKA